MSALAAEGTWLPARLALSGPPGPGGLVPNLALLAASAVSSSGQSRLATQALAETRLPLHVTSPTSISCTSFPVASSGLPKAPPQKIFTKYTVTMPWDPDLANGHGLDSVLAPPAPAPHLLQPPQQPAVPPPAEHREAVPPRRSLPGHDPPHWPYRYHIPEKPVANRPPPNPTNPPNPAGAPPRPVVKMKRTGNFGAFPMSSAPSLSTAASHGAPSTAYRPQVTIPQGPTHNTPRPGPSAPSAPSAPSVPSVPSTSRPGDQPHQGVQSKLTQPSHLDSGQPPSHHPAGPAPTQASKTTTSAVTFLRPFFQKVGEPKVSHLPNRQFILTFQY